MQVELTIAEREELKRLRIHQRLYGLPGKLGKRLESLEAKENQQLAAIRAELKAKGITS